MGVAPASAPKGEPLGNSVNTDAEAIMCIDNSVNTDAEANMCIDNSVNTDAEANMCIDDSAPIEAEASMSVKLDYLISSILSSFSKFISSSPDDQNKNIQEEFNLASYETEGKLKSVDQSSDKAIAGISNDVNYKASLVCSEKQNSNTLLSSTRKYAEYDDRKIEDASKEGKEKMST